MRKALLSFFIILSGVTASAAITESECPTVDFSDRFVPPRDQGSVNFCYAFTASDLLAEANDIKPPETVSALNVATNYIGLSPSEKMSLYQDISLKFAKPGFVESVSYTPLIGPGAKEKTAIAEKYMITSRRSARDYTGKLPFQREFGWTEVAMQKMIKKGSLCLESEVRSQKVPFLSGTTEQYGFFAQQLGKQAETSAAAYEGGFAMQGCAVCSGNLKNSPQHIQNQLQPVHGAVSNWMVVGLRSQQEAQCKNAIVPKGKVHAHHVMDSNNPSSTVAVIKDLLENKKRPFGLAYEACRMIECSISKNKEGITHSSVIVGRVWNKARQRCDLKIKNSWSKSCARKRSDVDCKDGYWSVGMENVLNAPHQIEWIEK